MLQSKWLFFHELCNTTKELKQNQSKQCYPAVVHKSTFSYWPVLHLSQSHWAFYCFAFLSNETKDSFLPLKPLHPVKCQENPCREQTLQKYTTANEEGKTAWKADKPQRFSSHQEPSPCPAPSCTFRSTEISAWGLEMKVGKSRTTCGPIVTACAPPDCAKRHLRSQEDEHCVDLPRPGHPADISHLRTRHSQQAAELLGSVPAGFPHTSCSRRRTGSTRS